LTFYLGLDGCGQGKGALLQHLKASIGKLQCHCCLSARTTALNISINIRVHLSCLKRSVDAVGSSVSSLHSSDSCSVLAEVEGGTVVDSIEDCTHAVLRHVKQDEYQRAEELGTISVVRPEWVIHCAAKQHLQDEVGVLQDNLTSTQHG
jgi:hypothetical protein